MTAWQWWTLIALWAASVAVAGAEVWRAIAQHKSRQQHRRCSCAGERRSAVRVIDPVTVFDWERDGI